MGTSPAGLFNSGSQSSFTVGAIFNHHTGSLTRNVSQIPSLNK